MVDELVPNPDTSFEVNDQENKGKLGFFTIFLITINSIVGTGIFFLPAIGAREAGLFAIISWIIMGAIAIYYSMIFAELIGLFPKEGGVYEYAKMAFGPFWSFVLGWMTLIAANVTIAMLIVGAVKYIGPFLPDAMLIAVSIAFVFLFNYMAFKGLKTSSVMLVAFAIITITSVCGIMIPGLINFDPSNFVGWFAHSAFSNLEFSFMGIIGGISVIFVTIFLIAETFFGWETATFLAEKVKNPRKVMPKVLIRATIIIAVGVLLFVIASSSLIHWSVLGNSLTPLSDLATVIYGAVIGKWYALLVYLAIMGSVAGWIVASPNLIIALAKDKLFIPQLSKIHPKTKTPYKAIIFQAILTSILVIVGAGNYEALLHILVPLVLVLYSSVVLSLLVVRKKFKDTPRPYKAPLGKTGPIILILFGLSLVVLWGSSASHAISTLGILFGFLFFSLPLFLLLFFHYDPQATIRFKNETAVVSIFFERVFFPKRIHKKVLANAKIEGNIVLELGASSGLLSRDIAKRHPKEQIIIEQSEHLKRIIQKRAKGEHNVTVLVDEHLISRVHPDVKNVDEIFSFGLLSDLQSEEVFLKQLADLLPENGRIHFFDYVDLYKIIPNKMILSDMEALKKLFREAGFAVIINKYKGLFWNYLVIDGIKTNDEEISFI